MGVRVSLSRSIHDYRARNDRRILLLGLDNTGKTTIFRFLETQTAPTAQAYEPTSTFKVIRTKHGKFNFSIWDVGGADKLRPYWRHYYTGTQGVIFVVDSTDAARLELAATELKALSRDEQLAGAAIVVLVNKSDLTPGVDIQAISTTMGLRETLEGVHPWTILSSTAVTGVGVAECCNFLADKMPAL